MAFTKAEVLSQAIPMPTDDLLRQRRVVPATGRRLEWPSFRRRRPTATGKEIEVDAFVRLGDMLDEQSFVAARRSLRARLPLGPARLEFRVGHQQ